ncbi:MAG: hypothetical protein Q8Q28_10355 [Pseudomonadota bacterium]|nr:hypothetical protein [Pseudomonadota bacterium]
MKRAKQMQALARQRYERQVMKGLKDIKAGRVYSDEQVEAKTDLILAIAEAKRASGAALFRRPSKRWWAMGLDFDEMASDALDTQDCNE